MSLRAIVTCHQVPVNYDEDTLEGAIARNEFALVHVSDYCRKHRSPLIGTGLVVQQIHEVSFGTRIESRDLRSMLITLGTEKGFEFGLGFCDVLAALGFARLFPNKQLENPLKTLFYCEAHRGDAHLAELCLDKERDLRRFLCMELSKPSDMQEANVHFLAVPNLERPAF